MGRAILGVVWLAFAGHLNGQEPRPCPENQPSAHPVCVQVEVPEDHWAESGRRITLRVLVLGAEEGPKDPDPVFVISGGPGQAATDLVGAYAGSRTGALASRDIVFVDQRGTGGSNSLACQVAADPAAHFGRILPSDETLRACLSEVSIRADPALYITTQAVEDLEAVRTALGYGQINVRGRSYGTRVVLEYLRRHPSSVRTALVTGVVPPNFKAPLMYARYAQHALERLFRDCDDDPTCHVALPDVAEEWETLRTRLGAAPARVTVHAPGGDSTTALMSADDLAYTVRTMMYGPDALDLPFLIHEATVTGDVSAFADRYAQRAVRAWSALSAGMHLSVFCAEDVPFISDGEVTQATEGTFLGSYLVQEYRRACAQWPRGRIPADFRDPVVSDRPVLVLSGRRDPSTPTATGQAALAYLPGGAHVVHHYGGHGFTGSPDVACTDRILERFLATGTTDGLDLTCVAAERPLPFGVPHHPGDSPRVRLGWYRTSDGDHMLVSPGPGGGWRHLDFAAADFGALRFGTEDGDARANPDDTDGEGLIFRDRSWRPDPTPPYALEEVRFASEDAMLAGPLLIPASQPAVAGAVLIHGSGDSDRDNVWAYTFADALARRGIAVLFADKRGSGASQGSWKEVGFDQLARDAHAAQVQLAKRTGLPLDRIGWVGLSQGGWIAPLAAIHAAKGGYVASVSAAAVPVFQQIRHEVTRTLEREGVGPEGVSAAHGLMQALEGFALGTVPWERYLAIRTGLMDGPAGPFAAAMPDTREDWRWEWWARVGLYDPVEAWNRSGHPTLVVYGAEDEQDNVPVATSVERLHALRQRPGAPRLDAHVLPGLGHALVDPESGWVSAGALERLAGWILDAVGSKGGAG